MVKERASFAIRPKLKKRLEKAAQKAELTLSQYIEKMVESTATNMGLLDDK
jgi:predicted HicB family RNase H-like nuclease